MLKPLSRLSLALVFVLLAACAAPALAQQAQPDVYVVVTYLKTVPGQAEAYRTYLSTTAKKVFQEQMAATPNLLAWSSAEMLYNGTEHGSDFDFVGASVYAGPPPEPSALPDPIAQKAAGMSAADLSKKLASMRTIVGTEILRQRAGTTGPAGLGDGDYRVIARIRVKPGMGDEYYDLARVVTQPLMQGRVAAGELKSWSVWSRLFPAGAATSYDALSVTYFKDLANAIGGLDARKGVENFLKTYPDRNLSVYLNNQRDYSELQQRMLMRVVSRVERAR
jgi:hypothetical protein